MARELSKIRNIGIIAHIDAGKTTLTERMLFYAGKTHRMGEVDKGTTATDVDPEEQQRGITIYSAAITFAWKGMTVNLIDTPGHVDFTAEVERSLRVLDGGVVVFSAREGVEAQSETVWRQADKYKVPRIAFINKMDREGADFYATLEQIRKRLGHNPVALQIPVGAGPPHVQDAFRGIVDLVSMKLLTFPELDQGSKVVEAEIPEEMADQAKEYRAVMLDELSKFSDELMELLLEEAPIPEDLIRKVVRQATIVRQVVPVLCGSALDHTGVQPVLDAVANFLPSPADVPPVEGDNPNKPEQRETRKADDDEPFCGLVFKIQAEKHGDLAWVRVYSGTLKANTRAFNPRQEKKENIAQLWLIRPGGKDEQVKQVEAGDIVGVIGLRNSVTGDTLCDVQHPILLESIEFPETVISMAIEPESSIERKKLAETLELMKRQDPTFLARENEETGQTLISGMGELHLEVIKHRLLRDFNLNVKVHKPRVSYRETIQKAATAVGECHRQIGGQQTFAKVSIALEPHDGPLPPVSIAAIAGREDLPPVLINAAKEELTAASGGGGLYGNPLSKVKVRITDAEASLEESTEAAFRIAANDAFEKALRAAGVQILEPIMSLQITTPEDYQGPLINDLQQRRAIIHETDPRGAVVVIKAEAPLANLFGYSSDIRSLSQGRASCSMQPADYGPAPPEVLANFA